jgi:hypothetical protein
MDDAEFRLDCGLLTALARAEPSLPLAHIQPRSRIAFEIAEL